MGAKGHPEEPGMLETSPGAIAAVVLFFLVTTLGFEYLLHTLKHYLKKRNKRGLLVATKNLAGEIMLLGLASLLLMAFAPALTKVCVKESHVFKPWIDNVEPCACCLSRTKGVSPCFLMNLQCPADFKQQCDARAESKGEVIEPDPAICADYVAPTSDDAEADSPSTSSSTANGTHAAITAASSPAAAASQAAHTKRRLMGDLVVTESGPTCDDCYKEAYEECGYRVGYVPAITTTLLEQVHMLLFFAAIIHIVCSLAAMLFGILKLRAWAHWAGGAAEDDLASRALAAAQRPLPLLAPPATANSPRAAVLPGEVPSAGNGAPSLSISPKEWTGRPFLLEGPAGHAKELGIILLRLLLAVVHPVVTTQEYSLIRAKFYYHNAHIINAALQEEIPGSVEAKVVLGQDGPAAKDQTEHDDEDDHGHKHKHGNQLQLHFPPHKWRGVFSEYLLESMERDAGKAVGLGLPMWCLLIVFVLVSGGIGWSTWLFSAIAGLMLALLNATLIYRLRKSTRGGNVYWNKVWPIPPWLILEFVKLLLFFLSFVVGNSIFFAAFFGPRSCFFSTTGFQTHAQPAPWWAILFVDVILMMYLALLTLPLYTLTFHTSKVDKQLLLEMVRRDRLVAAAKARSNTATESAAGHTTQVTNMLHKTASGVEKRRSNAGAHV